MSSVAFSNFWIRGMVLGKEASGPSSVRRKVTGGSPPGRGPSAGDSREAFQGLGRRDRGSSRLSPRRRGGTKRPARGSDEEPGRLQLPRGQHGAPRRSKWGFGEPGGDGEQKLENCKTLGTDGC